MIDPTRLVEWLEFQFDSLAWHERMAARPDITEEGRQNSRARAAEIRLTLEIAGREVTESDCPMSEACSH